MNPKIFIFVLSALVFLSSAPARAWYMHQEMMKVWSQKVDLPDAKIVVPCVSEETAGMAILGQKLSLNAAKVPLFSKHTDCKSQVFTTLRQMVEGPFIDEPDSGMDMDRPDSDDPNHDRSWMGGATGPTSQGFRHMEFGGFSFSSPIASFQIPFRRIGEAQNRVRTLWKAGDDIYTWRELPEANRNFFSYRVKFWALHVIQDLTQPFHTRQILNMRMVPWSSLFSGFVARTTQAISNYHYAYEDLILEMVKQDELQDLNKCLALPTAAGGVPAKFDFDVALSEILSLSRSVASDLGALLVQFFDPNLKSTEIDLPKNIGGIDAYALTQNPSKSEMLKKISVLTCEQFKLYSKWTGAATNAKSKTGAN